MDTQRFDNLAVSVATGSSRRWLITGFGALAIGALLGRDAEAKSSGNKGNSGSNSNADCSAGCAHTAKDARKECQDKKNKATKKECLKKVKGAQATCRKTCELTQTTGTDTGTSTGTETSSAPPLMTGTETDTETGTESEGEFGILARDLCTIGGTKCQDDLGPNTCLIGTCVKQNNRARCEYTRNPEACTDPEKPVCCNYRLGSSTSGQCVNAGPEGDRNAYCVA